MMKKIALIYMGGTFGCVGEPLSPMPAEQFLPRLAQVLPLNLEIECFPSSEQTFRAEHPDVDSGD